jgi:LysM repeat protein
MNFETVLNDCIDRLNMGQPIDDILGEYPEYADDIADLLDFGLLIPHARAESSEVHQVMHRLTTDIDTLIDAEFGDTGTSIAPRRLVRFPYQRIAAGLVIIFTGLLVLTLFQPDDENVLNPPPEILISDTPAATITPTMTYTQEPSATFTPTMTDTQEPSPTSTHTVTSSPTMTNTATVTIEPSATPILPTATAEGCTLPHDWTTYRVQAGDTISGIAVRSSANLDEIYSANCLERGDFIITGQEFFVPREPIPSTAIPTLTSIAPTIIPLNNGGNQQSNDGGTVPQPADNSNSNGGNDEHEDDEDDEPDEDDDDEEDDDEEPDEDDDDE